MKTDFERFIVEKECLALARGRRRNTYIGRLCTFYVTLVRAREPLGAEFEQGVELFLSRIPQKIDELVIYLWALNGHARYLCFVRRDYRGAQRVLRSAATLSRKIYGAKVTGNDPSAKSLLPFTLALNIARLSGYAGRSSQAVRQFRGLLRFSEGLGAAGMSAFPKEIAEQFRQDRRSLDRIFQPRNRGKFCQTLRNAVQKLESERLTR